jgi:hypothetical protein
MQATKTVENIAPTLYTDQFGDAEVRDPMPNTFVFIDVDNGLCRQPFIVREDHTLAAIGGE